MNQPPINPDALEAGAKALYNEEPWQKSTYSVESHSWEEIQEEDRQAFREEAEVAVSAYLTVAQPVVNSAEWTLNGVRANFEWGGQIHNDPAEFDRVINQVRAQALIDLADQMRDKFTASWIRRKAREYTHGPHKPVGAFAIPEEKNNGDKDL